ncbi:MAG: hypothetical protein MZU95_06930 [Desulfomicrobium escambiense]|nr:hypothetical protein [Desulfomicrobium escambiense]
MLVAAMNPCADVRRGLLGTGGRLHGGREGPLLLQDLRPAPRPDRHPARRARGQVRRHRLADAGRKLRGHPGPGDGGQGEADGSLRRPRASSPTPGWGRRRSSTFCPLPPDAERLLEMAVTQARLQRPGLRPRSSKWPGRSPTSRARRASTTPHVSEAVQYRMMDRLR